MKPNKTPNPNQTKVPKQVQCQVSSNSKDLPGLSAETWPQKLLMQLMPKTLIGSIGGPYLKNSKSVTFHPEPCPALDNLVQVLLSGYAGCVHFTGCSNTCAIKILILLYQAEKKLFLGFIPNDQTGFVDRLRKLIQMQKQGNQRALQQAQQQNQQAQQAQQGMMISQTNQMAMVGGQITQVAAGGPGPQLQGLGQQANSGPSQGPSGPMGPGMVGSQNPMGMQGVDGNMGMRMQGPGAVGQGPQGSQGGPAGNIMVRNMLGSMQGSIQRAMGPQVPGQDMQQQIKQFELMQKMQQQQQQKQNVNMDMGQQVLDNDQGKFRAQLQLQQLQQKQMIPQGMQQQQQPQQFQQVQMQNPQRMVRPSTGNPGLRMLLQQQQPYRPQMMMQGVRNPHQQTNPNMQHQFEEF